jgi:hypothetical protein
MTDRWRAALMAGAVYFVLIFLLGFLLGTVRTILVGESGDRLRAVLIELPIMLAASWFVCGQVVRRCAVADAPAPRLAMGGFAFALLMLAELGVGALLFGRTPAEHFLLYREASYAIGLVAQVLFAAMPLAQLWARRRERR